MILQNTVNTVDFDDGEVTTYALSKEADVSPCNFIVRQGVYGLGCKFAFDIIHRCAVEGMYTENVIASNGVNNLTSSLNGNVSVSVL